uniref:Uncharacterized protein n=1 Tax=Loxodonta africana TaxID=9785 RepID=G3UFM1_LOXAF
QAFDQVVTKDAYMAIDLFQHGVANFQLAQFQEALLDLKLPQAQLRG